MVGHTSEMLQSRSYAYIQGNITPRQRLQYVILKPIYNYNIKQRTVTSCFKYQHATTTRKSMRFDWIRNIPIVQ